MSTPMAQFSRPQELPRDVIALVFMCTCLSIHCGESSSEIGDERSPRSISD